jgi:hypothetical protein
MVLHVLPFILAMAGQAAPPQQASPPQVPAETVRVAQPPPKIYNETADAKAQIAAAIEAAVVDDIRVFINWGANDDDSCKKFSQVLRGLKAPVGRSFFSDEFKVVNVDLGHLDKNLDLAKTYGVTPTASALPALTILDKTGKVLANASAPLFSTTDPAAFDSDKVAAFLTEHEAPVPDSNAPFEAALNQAKRDGKSVMVWFSAPW